MDEMELEKINVDLEHSEDELRQPNEQVEADNLNTENCRKKKIRKKSNVWEFFKLLPNKNTVECRHCATKIPHPTKSTGGMWAHMGVKHKIYNALLGRSIYKNWIPISNPKNEQDEINDAFLRMVVESPRFISFATAESQYFQEFIKFLKPTVELANKNHFKSKLLPIQLEKQNIKLEDYLKQRKAEQLLDGWCSDYEESD